MRLGLAALLFTGCIIEPPDTDYPSPGSGGGGGWGTGWGGGGGSSDYRCHADEECASGGVCARNGECLTASAVRVVRTTWTLAGVRASVDACAGAPKLAITFTTSGGGEMFGFSPVPCEAGKFTVDKLPTRFTTVTLGRVGDDYSGAAAVFDADGNAAIDLPY